MATRRRAMRAVLQAARWHGRDPRLRCNSPGVAKWHACAGSGGGRRVLLVLACFGLAPKADGAANNAWNRLTEMERLTIFGGPQYTVMGSVCVPVQSPPARWIMPPAGNPSRVYRAVGCVERNPSTGVSSEKAEDAPFLFDRDASILLRRSLSTVCLRD